jgi:hypothetical protein
MSDAAELDHERETPLHKEYGIWVYRSVSAEAGVDADSVLDEVREQRSQRHQHPLDYGRALALAAPPGAPAR